ncbi:MAG: holin [Lachnospiraceae bacterium]|nr:holin [Lachnospiraceae bacterium]
MDDVKIRIWCRAAGIRALKTMAQTAIAMIGTNVAVNRVDWNIVLSASVLAGILSLLTSIAGLPELKENQEEN